MNYAKKRIPQDSRFVLEYLHLSNALTETASLIAEGLDRYRNDADLEGRALDYLREVGREVMPRCEQVVALVERSPSRWSRRQERELIARWNWLFAMQDQLNEALVGERAKPLLAQQPLTDEAIWRGLGLEP